MLVRRQESRTSCYCEYPTYISTSQCQLFHRTGGFFHQSYDFWICQGKYFWQRSWHSKVILTHGWQYAHSFQLWFNREETVEIHRTFRRRAVKACNKDQSGYWKFPCQSKKNLKWPITTITTRKSPHVMLSFCFLAACPKPFPKGHECNLSTVVGSSSPFTLEKRSCNVCNSAANSVKRFFSWGSQGSISTRFFLGNSCMLVIH